MLEVVETPVVQEYPAKESRELSLSDLHVEESNVFWSTKVLKNDVPSALIIFGLNITEKSMV